MICSVPVINGNPYTSLHIFDTTGKSGSQSLTKMARMLVVTMPAAMKVELKVPNVPVSYKGDI